MADVFSKAKLSQVMSRIRGRGNISTELTLARLFRQNGIKGWRRHLRLPGTPDFAFQETRIAVFVDGCFWHGCPRCFSPPKANRKFWDEKMSRNRLRDRRVNSEMRRRGWFVLRVWEHQLPNPSSVIRRITRNLILFSVKSTQFSSTLLSFSLADLPLHK